MKRELDNSQIRKLNNWKPLEEVKFLNNVTPVFNQTKPPSIPVEQQYPNGLYPVVHEVEYTQSTARNNQEKITLDTTLLMDVNDCRKAAEVHRQTRRYIQEIIKPGIDLTYLCNEIERSNKLLLNA